MISFFKNKNNLLFLFLFLLISISFSYFIFFTKNFIEINGDTSIFIDYFWRIQNNQIPHLDFRSLFGPTLKLFFVIGDFFNNILFNGKLNILESFLISKLIFSIFIFLFSFFLIKELLDNKKISIFLSIIISLYISSYALTSRAFGYFSLQSLTSFYNSFILSVFFLIIIFIIYLFSNYKLKNKSILNSYILSFIFGLTLSLLTHLKITAAIICLPLLIFLFLINDKHSRYNFYYFLIGGIFYIIIIIGIIGYKAYACYIIENFNYFKIAINPNTNLLHDVRLNAYLMNAAFYNALKDSFILATSLFIFNKIIKNKIEFYYPTIIKIFLLIFSYFLVAYFLQILSAQNVESGIGEFVLLIFVSAVIVQKLNLIKKILSGVLLIGPAIIAYKNILIPVSFYIYSLYGVSISTNQEKEYYKNYANNNFIEKIFYSQKKFNFNSNEAKLNLIKYYQLYDNPKISHYQCETPISYFTKTIPPKNSNLYWHDGMNFNENYFNISNDDETNMFFDCGGIISNINFETYFSNKIKFSDNIILWLR